MNDVNGKIDDMDLDLLEDIAADDIENETDESTIDITELDDETKEALGVKDEEMDVAGDCGG